MKMISMYFVFFLFLSTVSADSLRLSSPRIRDPTMDEIESSTGGVKNFFKTLVSDPFEALQLFGRQDDAGEVSVDLVEQEQNEFEALQEIFDTLAELGQMSMNTASPFINSAPGPSTSPVTPDTPVPVALVGSFAPVSTPTAPIATPVSIVAPINALPPVNILDNSLAPTQDVICTGISIQQRIADILAILDEVADPIDIRDTSTSEGLATVWLLEQDSFFICPDNVKLVQRWTLAVIYFSTGGDDWFQCSRDANVTTCGGNPFQGNQRFLSNVTECEWAGITCVNGCVTEIEFEQNNLVGTIPSEIGLLSDLIFWGMERGNLTSTIPTEVGSLTNLFFIDLDYNELTGTLSSELLSLSSLKTLDLNNNKFSGSISGIVGFPDIEFMQFHNNEFTGTIPVEVGSYSNLGTFSVQKTDVSGSIPQSVCDLLITGGNGGVLTSLVASCAQPNPSIVCACCTSCRLP